MAIEDLDLEFEDDEEEKSDALEVDVDLSFSASADSPKKAQANKKVVGKGTSLSADDATNPNLTIPKATKPAAKPAARPQAKPTQTPKSNAPAAKPQANNVANIADRQKAAKAAQPQQASQPVAQAKVTIQQEQSPVQAPAGLEDYQDELDALRAEIADLRKELQSVQQHADVKVAVAEAKSEFIIEYVTNAKLLDHQVNQVLQRIHKKVPALKTEVLTVKKYLTEFMEKNTKKK